MASKFTDFDITAIVSRSALSNPTQWLTIGALSERCSV